MFELLLEHALSSLDISFYSISADRLFKRYKLVYLDGEVFTALGFWPSSSKLNTFDVEVIEGISYLETAVPACQGTQSVQSLTVIQQCLRLPSRTQPFITWASICIHLFSVCVCGTFSPAKMTVNLP